MIQPDGNPKEAAGAGENEPGAALRPCIEVTSLNVRYDALRAISDLTMTIPALRVTALIGPSGCGKSTLLRCFNRMNDLIDNAVVEGKILLHGEDITLAGIDVAQLRRQVGIVFQKPVPFPRSVFDNVAYGLRLQQKIPRSELQDRVEQALRSAALWDEVEDRLQQPAHELSGGQQQRLVIARAIAIAPQVLLLDEPASALDPLSTFKIEELITRLKEHYTIVIVTHNMQQAARVSDYTALLDDGKLIEYADTNTIFTNPGKQQTEDYITGRYG